MPAFRAHIAETIGPAVVAARTRTSLGIDAAITARAARPDFVRDIERAGPFGAGNPAPMFALPAHRAKFPDVVGAAGHVRLTVMSEDGAKLKAIAFRAADTELGQALLSAGDRPLHLAGSLSLDHYQGREEVQVRIVDAAWPPAL
jgi:single-stranded-DNA-specific exonuclease